MTEEKSIKSSSKFYDELVSFMQQKGFIWGPEPEIYGGLAGFYTYAPLGKLLKNNVNNKIAIISFYIYDAHKKIVYEYLHSKHRYCIN